MSILCYHAVDPTWKSPLSITPESFAAHCAWLARSRTVVPLDVALGRLDSRGRLPRGTVALTFDDGFAQLHDYVFPTLARHGLPSTVFVVAATLTEAGHPVDWVDTPPPWELQTLTLDQLRSAQADGVQIASHSWSHETLPEMDEDATREDLRASRELLQDLFHDPVSLLAYPRGKHDAATRRATRDAGFSHGLALPESKEPLSDFSVPRVGVFPGNESMALRVKTDPMYLDVRHSPVFPALRRVVRRG